MPAKRIHHEGMEYTKWNTRPEFWTGLTGFPATGGSACGTNRIAPSAAKGPLAWRRGKIEEVLHDSVIAGDFFADMLVEGTVMVENKSVQALVAAHEVQLVNYLTATGIEVGLLLNFGSVSLEVKRKTRTYRPKSS